MVAIVPVWYRSDASGSSLSADFCATKNIFLSPLFAFSIAAIYLSLPTNKGITKWGYTTTSLKGSIGNICVIIFFIIFLISFAQLHYEVDV